MAENRYTKAAKATIEKHSPQAEINVMGEDPDGNRWIMTKDAPGVKKYLGDDIPGGTIEGFGDRSITALPSQGGGDEYQLRMGQHRDRPSKPAAEEWGGSKAIEDLIYPGGVPSGGIPIAPSDLEEGGPLAYLRRLAPSAGLFDTHKSGYGLSADEAKKVDDQNQREAEEAQKIRNQNQREELDIQIEDANFPDPRTGDAVRRAVDDMLAEQFVGLKLLSTSAEHKDGVPDNIYFEAEDGSRWEWNSNGEIHRAD